VSLTVIVEHTKPAGLMGDYLGSQREKYPHGCALTTEVVAVMIRQSFKFLYVDVMVSTYTTCPGRQMDVSKLIVEMVRETEQKFIGHHNRWNGGAEQET